MNEKDFKKELTREDIQAEVNKLEDFFEQIPDDLKIESAQNIIFHALFWSSNCLCHGLGMLEEAKFRYREILSKDIEEDDIEEDDIEEDDIEEDDIEEDDIEDDIKDDIKDD